MFGVLSEKGNISSEYFQAPPNSAVVSLFNLVRQMIQHGGIHGTVPAKNLRHSALLRIHLFSATNAQKSATTPRPQLPELPQILLKRRLVQLDRRTFIVEDSNRKPAAQISDRGVGIFETLRQIRAELAPVRVHEKGYFCSFQLQSCDYFP